jgi:hypothetical protein
MKVVVRGLPFHNTVDPLTKPDPLTVSVNSGVPAGVTEGERKPWTGTPFKILKFLPPEVPPPGEGLKAVTEAVPDAAISEARMDAVNLFALTNVVVWSEPFQRTLELEMKPDPFTVKVNAGPPAPALVGVMEVRTGVGFCAGGGLDPPPPPPQAAKARATNNPATNPVAVEAARWCFVRFVVKSRSSV